MKRQKRWILRYQGDSNSSKGSTLLSVLKSRSIEILDDNLPKMVLVAGTKAEIESTKKEIDANWIVAEENTSYPIPDTRKKISVKTV